MLVPDGKLGIIERGIREDAVVDQIGGQGGDLDVVLLGDPAEQLERLIAGDAVPVHQDPGGLSDQGAGVQCAFQVVAVVEGVDQDRQVRGDRALEFEVGADGDRFVRVQGQGPNGAADVQPNGENGPQVQAADVRCPPRPPRPVGEIGNDFRFGAFA